LLQLLSVAADWAGYSDGEFNTIPALRATPPHQSRGIFGIRRLFVQSLEKMENGAD
jgi:hypothetical protein